MSEIKTAVLEFYPDGTPKMVHFQPHDFDWIRSYATRELIKRSPNVQLIGDMGPKTFIFEEFRMFCLMEATMAWMHRTGIVKDCANVMFKTAWPDSQPMTEDADWPEPKEEKKP
jgi:hypothetical protein